MNEISNFSKEPITMSSREISTLVGSSHDNVLKTIRRLIDGGIVSKTEPRSYQHQQNKQTYYEYFLNKRDSLIVVVRLSPEFTAVVIDRWQELERELENANKPAIPQTYAAALLEAGRLALEVEKQAEQLLLAKPKVEFVDKFTSKDALQNATQVGQTLKMSAVKLNRTLDELGGIYNKSVKRGRVFSQSWIDDGYGKMVQTEAGYPQAIFTTSGVVRVTELLTTNGVI